jgi:hypothetical protein
MKPRARLLAAVARIAVIATALAFWVAVARACKDLMQ